MSHLTLGYFCHPILPGHMLCPKHTQLEQLYRTIVQYLCMSCCTINKLSDEIIMRRNTVYAKIKFSSLRAAYVGPVIDIEFLMINIRLSANGKVP